jgi:glyoxylase-like metal-dependent hydrolase (beta-lactamase superfamily II)
MTDLPLTRRAAFAVAAGAALAAGAPAAAATSPAGPSRPFLRRFALGSFEVSTITDGFMMNDAGPHPTFGENQSAEAVAALAAENLLPADRAASMFTVTMVNTGADVVLFDAGNGAGRRPGAGLLRERLAASGIAPEAVTVVVVTHFHPDHIGGLMEGGAPAFPNARYVTGRAEWDFMTGPDAPERLRELIAANVTPLAAKFGFVEPGQTAVAGIEAVDASGHTPGHMAWHVESEGARLLVTADTVNHFVFSLQRPDWHVRFDMDKEKAAATRRRILGMLAADRIPFVGYHMPPPAVGFVEAAGDTFRYVPETYQLGV